MKCKLQIKQEKNKMVYDFLVFRSGFWTRQYRYNNIKDAFDKHSKYVTIEDLTKR